MSNTASGFSLVNDGGFVCSMHALYIDDKGNNCDQVISGNFPVDQEKTEMLNKCPNLSPGTWVMLKVWIELGSDRSCAPNYKYDPNGPIQCYRITGTTLESTIHYLGAKSKSVA